MNGTFKGWNPRNSNFGFIAPDGGGGDVFVHKTEIRTNATLSRGTRLTFDIVKTNSGMAAHNVSLVNSSALNSARTSNVFIAGGGLGEQVAAFAGNNSSEKDSLMESEEVEEYDTAGVDHELLKEIAAWKREARAEDGNRYFWHVREVDEIERGEKHYVIGRKGSGKTAISEYFIRLNRPGVFSEKLTFKNFPFNELYEQKNRKYTTPNQFITLWKYLIYSTICRLMIKNESVDITVREQLSELYENDFSLSRRVIPHAANS